MVRPDIRPGEGYCFIEEGSTIQLMVRPSAHMATISTVDPPALWVESADGQIKKFTVNSTNPFSCL